MIKPIAKEVMIDVKMLTNPQKLYKVKRCVEVTNSNDIYLTINGCQHSLINNIAIGMNDLKENVAIIFQTLKNKCVINIDPAQQNISIVQKQLGNALNNLRNKMKYSYDEVIGLVVGGRSFDNTNKFAYKGVQLTDAICEFIENEHIPATKLLEQHINRQAKGVDFYSYKGDVVLSNGIINDFIKANSHTPEQIHDTGKKLFEIFEVSPHAPIRLVDEVPPRPFTNSKYL